MNTRTITRSKDKYAKDVDESVDKLHQLVDSLYEQSQDEEYEICEEILKAITTISQDTGKKCIKLTQINSLLNIIQ